MIIVQISDLHIAPPGEKTCAVAPMAENLARVIAHIRAAPHRPDLVIVTGDITHDTTPAEARHARSMLEELPAPWRIVPGNHDRRALLRDHFGPETCPATAEGFIQHVTDLGPLCLIGLDSLDEGKPGGRLCQSRLDWLAEALSDAGGRRVLLYLHHPPLPLGVPETDEDGFAGANALGRLVSQHGGVERILCGHVHLATHAGWRGSIVSTAPSIGMELTLDLTPAPPPSRFRLRAPGYMLHHLHPSGGLVSHVVSLPEDERTHGF